MKYRVSFLLVAAAAATPAAAQQQVGGGFSITADATLTSDYRFRGISQTGEEPALQASATLSHDSGFYAGTFATTLGDARGFGDYEIDVFAGYAFEIATATELDVGVSGSFYPDAPDDGAATDYGEIYASLRHTLGPVTAELGALYAPEQEALGDRDNLYVFADLEGGIPFTPVTVTAHVGRTDGGLVPPVSGALAARDYFDWSLGAQITRGAATFALEYVDTDLPSGPDVDGALVASVRFGF